MSETKYYVWPIRLMLVLGMLSLILELIRFFFSIIHQDYDLIYSRSASLFVYMYFLYVIYKLRNAFLSTQVIHTVCIITLMVIVFSFYSVLILNNYFYVIIMIAVANAIIRGLVREM